MLQDTQLYHTLVCLSLEMDKTLFDIIIQSKLLKQMT